MSVTIRIEGNPSSSVQLQLYEVRETGFAGKEYKGGIEQITCISGNSVTVGIGQSKTLFIADSILFERFPGVKDGVIVPNFLLVGYEDGGAVAIEGPDEVEEGHLIKAGDKFNFSTATENFKRVLGLPETRSTFGDEHLAHYVSLQAAQDLRHALAQIFVEGYDEGGKANATNQRF